MISVLILTAGLLLISLFTLNARAADPTAEEFFVFDGAGTITGYDNINGPSDVVIPATIGGIPVTAIGDYAFEGYLLTSIVIPDSVETIGNGAFTSNDISILDLGEGIVTIGAGAFLNNSLTSVTLPDSLETIGGSAFSGNSLTGITLPDSLTTLGGSAFHSNQITSAFIPDSVTTVNSSIFANNPLTTLTVGTADFSGTPTMTIQSGAFTGGVLESVTIGNSVTTIGAAFYGNPITHLDLGESVQSIGGGAFNNTLLETIVIPDSVTQLDGGAFSGGPSVLKSLTIGTRDFTGAPTLTLFGGIFNNGTIETLKLGNTVADVSGGTFCGNPITLLDLGEALTNIGPSAFCNTQLTSVVIPDSVTQIGGNAFGGNALLTSATIGSLDFTGTPGMTIGSGTGVFSGSPLTTLVIGNSVTTIDSMAFSDLDINSLTLGANLQTIGASAFSANEITSVVFPASLTLIDALAFEDNNITSITVLGDTVIDPTAFVTNVDNTGRYIEFYTGDSTNPFGYTDLADTYIVNPAQAVLRYVATGGAELLTYATEVGETLGDYTVANNPTGDFSLYYRLGDSFAAAAPVIAGYITPANQSVVLSAGSNVLSFAYVAIGSNLPGVPNTGSMLVAKALSEKYSPLLVVALLIGIAAASYGAIRTYKLFVRLRN